MVALEMASVCFPRDVYMVALVMASVCCPFGFYLVVLVTASLCLLSLHILRCRRPPHTTFPVFPVHVSFTFNFFFVLVCSVNSEVNWNEEEVVLTNVSRVV